MTMGSRPDDLPLFWSIHSHHSSFLCGCGPGYDFVKRQEDISHQDLGLGWGSSKSLQTRTYFKTKHLPPPLNFILPDVTLILLQNMLTAREEPVRHSGWNWIGLLIITGEAVLLRIYGIQYYLQKKPFVILINVNHTWESPQKTRTCQPWQLPNTAFDTDFNWV